jgi:hypothetical protein
VSFKIQQIERLMQRGGWALLRLRQHGHSRGMRVGSWDYEEDASTAYGYTMATEVVLPPSALEIDLMDITMGWLSHIRVTPARRVTAMRMLYDDERGRHVVPLKVVAKRMHITPQNAFAMHRWGLDEVKDAVNKDNALVHKMMLYIQQN